VAFEANTSMSEIMATQQTMRVAMNAVSRDIVMAGTGLPSGGIPVPHGTNSTALSRPGVGGTLPTANNVLAILTPGDSAGPTVAAVQTDALTIVSIDQESPSWSVSAINAAGTEIDFVQDVRTGTAQLFEDDVLLITNVNGSVFGCVTGVSESESQANFADADALDINQPNAQFGNIKSLANPDGTYPPTTATRVMIITYYLDNSVAAHPRLMRSVNAQPPQIAVEDLENLQFSFDLFDFQTDTESSNQPTTSSPNQIRSVNVQINGRSPQTLRSSGEYYRFGLVSKINVRNATFRNRYTGS
jgi:hypothetical protein